MYFQLSKCTFSQQFQYRESMFFQLIGKFIWIYINLCIWKALLAYREVGRSYEEMVVYVLVAEILLLLCHSNVAVDLAEKVKTGDISINLIRPVGLKWYSFCHISQSVACLQSVNRECPSGISQYRIGCSAEFLLSVYSRSSGFLVQKRNLCQNADWWINVYICGSKDPLMVLSFFSGYYLFLLAL